MTSGRRATGLRIGASAAVLAALFVWLPQEELRRGLSAVPLSLWIGCVAAFVGAHCIGAYKWHLLIAAGAAGVSYAATLRAYFAGLFANLFLPSVAGGDVVRAGLAMRSREAKQAVVLGSVLDRLIDTAVLLLFVVVGAGMSQATLTSSDGVIVVLTALGVGAAAAIIVGFLVLPAPDWIPSKISAIREELRDAALTIDKGRIATAVVLSCFVQGLFVFLNAKLGVACGISLDAGGWLFAWPLAKLAAMLPVTMGGIGLREAALAALLGRFGVAPAAAVAVGLVWETVLIAGAACGSLFYVSLRRRTQAPAVGADRV